MRKILLVLMIVSLFAAACSGGNDGGVAHSGGDDSSDAGTAPAEGDQPDDMPADSGETPGTPDPGDPDPGTSGDDPTGSGEGTATNGEGEVIILDPEEVALTVRLVRFDECAALLDHIHTEYSARVGPWGFDSGGGWIQPMPIRAMVEPMMVQADMAESFDDSGSISATPLPEPAPVPAFGADVEFSETNVQEQGADEPDVVKTDGRRILVISDGRLAVVDVATQAKTGEVEIADGWSPELFLSGDSVLVIQNGGFDSAIPAPLSTSSPRVNTPRTVIQRLEIENGVPRITSTTHVEGNYVSARSIGGTARIVLQFDPQWTFPFVYPRNETGEDTAEQANRAAVLNSTLDDWLPQYSTNDGAAWQRLTSCDRVHAPSEFSGFGLTTVVSMPVDGALDASVSTTVLAPGDLVYASTEALYTATRGWFPISVFDDEEAHQRAWDDRRTSIHRFDISGADGATYTASGSVPGDVRDQFSLSDHAGHLRVVTTTGGGWWGDQRNETVSQVRVMREVQGTLTEVGSVGDIGKGEAVQSVRFVGDVGYVVTFRQIDPFYTIDLSDPTNPVIRGELKIPGFSSYLHPISDDLVLGVGSDADETGMTTGAKVSLFDVSNLDDPREVAVWTAPGGWSDISWDHRAFLYWAPENLVVIPVTVHGNARQDGWSGAVLLEISDDEITEVGRVDHLDDEGAEQVTCRALGPDDLPSDDPDSFTTDLAWQIADEYSWVFACAPGEVRGLTDDECWLPDPGYWREQAEPLGITIADDETISVCWPSGGFPQIVRSIAIGEDLWTLSYMWGNTFGDQQARLQVNSLSNYERLLRLDV